MRSRERRGIIFALVFWISVLVVYFVVYVADIRILFPTEFYVSYCALSPLSAFTNWWIFGDCSATGTVMVVDALIPMGLLFFGLLMLWVFQFMIMAFTPIFAYEYAEKYWVEWRGVGK